MTMIRSGILTAALLGLMAAAAPDTASAMPVAGLSAAPAGSAVEDVRLVCGPFRCFRVFGYYRRPFYRRYYVRPFYRRYY